MLRDTVEKVFILRVDLLLVPFSTKANQVLLHFKGSVIERHYPQEVRVTPKIDLCVRTSRFVQLLRVPDAKEI